MRAKQEGNRIGKIEGNTTGLKKILLRRIESLNRRRVSPHEVVSPDLSRDMARLSYESGRQLGLFLDRAGKVEGVVIGEARGIFLPDLPKSRVERRRLRGLRFVHTGMRSR